MQLSDDVKTWEKFFDEHFKKCTPIRAEAELLIQFIDFMKKLGMVFQIPTGYFIGLDGNSHPNQELVDLFYKNIEELRKTISNYYKEENEQS